MNKENLSLAMAKIAIIKELVCELEDFICIKSIEYDPLLELDIEELYLNCRPAKALRSESIHTIKDLIQYTEKELSYLPNIGIKSLKEIKDMLSSKGLSLSIK